MITFMPYPDFGKTAECLDWKYEHNRLNNQINEGIIICKTLLGHYEKGWASHPAVKMWKNYEMVLLEYTEACLVCWLYRKGKLASVENDDRFKAIQSLIPEIANINTGYNIQDLRMMYPSWFGYEPFHSSHRAILLGKMPVWYSQFGWKETPAIKDERGKWPYIWPVK